MGVSRVNALTGLGKNVPVLAHQMVQRGPDVVSAPVAEVGVPGAKTIESDMAQRVATRLGSKLDIRA